MKRILVLLATVIFSISCVTYGSYDSNYFRSPPTGSKAKTARQYIKENQITITRENEDIEVVLSIGNLEEMQVTIYNKSNAPIIIDWDGFSYVDQDKFAHRLIHGGVRIIEKEKPQAPQTLPGASRLADVLVPVDFIAKGKPLNWIPVPPNNISVTVAYLTNNKSMFLECVFSAFPDQKITKDSPIIGSVESKKVFIHPLFIATPESNRKALYKNAEEKARKEYGINIELVNLVYYSEWHFASLLFYFSMLGWVENATIMATVIKQ